jgi:DNA-binding XRE family transcriptional regulator
MNEIRETLREHVASAINTSGMSKKEIAAHLGLTQAAISNWLAGKTVPDIETMIRLCKLFHLTLNDMYFDDVPIIQSDPIRDELMDYYNKFTASGKLKLCDYACDLFNTGRYLKSTADDSSLCDEPSQSE